ncbi:hypothetical protein VaNZ11_001940 [Volvox africanus]|uniref:Methyltransferase small domain-containing protein n=1 Tax=Volvox africanus TaxID=51714 RepID=A0ABQ5RS11_9CHLO|nr:hypothetical protein VaNZ11_001940 [Volvox africanus]
MLSPSKFRSQTKQLSCGNGKLILTCIICARTSSAKLDHGKPPEERRKPFKFRQFIVYQDRCALKVGTDAMLLGSWTPPPSQPPPSRCPSRTCSILDVGTGTGVLALMMAQKTATATATHGATTATTAITAATAATATANAASADSPATTAVIGASNVASVINSGLHVTSHPVADIDPAAIPVAAAVATCPGTSSSSTGGNRNNANSGSDAGSGGWPRDGGPVRIVAIDVDAEACAQAAENAALSPWANRIKVLHCSLQQLAVATAAGGAVAAGAAVATAAGAAVATAAGAEPADGTTLPAKDGSSCERCQDAEGLSGPGQGLTFAAEDLGPFDLIITNPPYFVESSKPIQGRAHRAPARHADVSLPFKDLAAGCAALLAPGGCMCVILPPAEAQQFVGVAAACGLVMVELVKVYTTPEASWARRHLMKLQRAADLERQNLDVLLLPSISTLVINGPKEHRQPQKHQHHHHQDAQQLQLQKQRPWERDLDAAAWEIAKTEDLDITAAAATTATTTTTAAPSISHPRPAATSRRFTEAYLALTSSFHHPAFLQKLDGP